MARSFWDILGGLASRQNTQKQPRTKRSHVSYRKRLPNGKKRGRVFNIRPCPNVQLSERATDDDYAKIEVEAKKRGLSTSGWVREEYWSYWHATRKTRPGTLANLGYIPPLRLVINKLLVALGQGD